MSFIVPDEEKYVCGHCPAEQDLAPRDGQVIIGGRYNNHCPNCLWSKHLDDKIPGDRNSNCQSLMKPIGVIQKNSKWRIVHQCLKCKKRTVVDASPEDNIDLIIKLSQSPAD